MVIFFKATLKFKFVLCSNVFTLQMFLKLSLQSSRDISPWKALFNVKILRNYVERKWRH